MKKAKKEEKAAIRDVRVKVKGRPRCRKPRRRRKRPSGMPGKR